MRSGVKYKVLVHDLTTLLMMVYLLKLIFFVIDMRMKSLLTFCCSIVFSNLFIFIVYM